MNVELTVLAFDDESTAAEALKDLRQLQKDGIVKVLNAAVLIKDEKGKVSATESENVDAKHGALFGAITGGLIGLIGGPPGAIVGVAAGAASGSVAEKVAKFEMQTRSQLEFAFVIHHSYSYPERHTISPLTGPAI